MFIEEEKYCEYDSTSIEKACVYEELEEIDSDNGNASAEEPNSATLKNDHR